MPAGQLLCQCLSLRRLHTPGLMGLPTVFSNYMCPAPPAAPNPWCETHGASEHCSPFYKAFRQPHSDLPLTCAKKLCPTTAKSQVMNVVCQLCLAQKVTAQQRGRRLCCKVAGMDGQNEMLTKEKHLTAHERHTGGSGFVRLAATVIGDHVLEVTNKCYLNTLSGIISNQNTSQVFLHWGLHQGGCI